LPGGGSGATTIVNPLTGGTLLGFLNNILNFITTKIAPIIIILMLVYIGFLFTTTSVNPENKQKAREYLLWTVIGALILLGAQAIALGIEATVQALSTGP
jgi:type IV secretory pathway VirB2 component (pilin)